VRKRVYEILTLPRRNDVLGRVLNGALMLLIAVNVVASAIETDVEIARRAPRFFDVLEVVSVIVFTIEYVLRLWSCTADPVYRGAIRGRIRYALRPSLLVDLVAILPSYIELFLPGALDLRFLRVLRLLRVFRLLRHGPFAEAFATLVDVVRSKKVALLVSLTVVFVAMLVSAGAIYLVEHDEPGSQFTSIPRAMWWAVETITTIGYGDMIPTTAIGRIVAGFVAFLGICAVALPVGIVSSGYVEAVGQAKRADLKRTCPHCGEEIAG
jgi:voltage-gated potassium channel